MANKQYAEVNPQGKDSKGGNDGQAEKGQALKEGANFKETATPNASMSKLPQREGAE